MSLITKVTDLATRVGTEFKAVRSTIGPLSSLTTTDKTSIVAAINEALTEAGAQIDDATASTTTVYSSTKTDSQITAATSSKLDSASYTASDVLSKLLTVDGSGSGLDADTLDGVSSTGFATASHDHSGAYQPVDGDLTAIAALAGTAGLLKKTATDTWTLDTSSYALASALGDYVLAASKGAASGVATLDSAGLLPTSQLPALAITQVSVVASQSAMLALTAERGDVAIRTDLNKSFILASDSPTTLADWKELLTPTDAVGSVDGRTGSVTLSDLYAPYSLVAAVGDTTTDFVTVFEAALV